MGQSVAATVLEGDRAVEDGVVVEAPVVDGVVLEQHTMARPSSLWRHTIRQ